MANKDINIIAEQLDSLHKKILDSKFAEQVTESEVLALYLAVAKINKQAAEIERLRKEADEQFNKWKLLGERTKERYAELYEEAKEVVKSEARKEFAENLKQDIKSHRLEMNMNGLKGSPRTDEITYGTIIEYIDNLLEEMENKS